MDLKIKTLEVGPLEVNCYILSDGRGRGVVIDPGGDAARIIKAINSLGIEVKYIVNTHGHFDHVGADGEIKSFTGAPIAIHSADRALLLDAHSHGAFFGVDTPVQPEPDILLQGGEILVAGEMELEVIHTPGHTPGGICLLLKEGGVVFTGDTLFAGSVGRTDFEYGSMETLLGSIRKGLLVLDDDVRVLPGHGPETTIGYERLHNPFLTGEMLER